MNKTKMIAIGFAGVVTVISAWLLANGFTNFKKDAPTINVTGMAEKQITSDLIVWNITVNAEDVFLGAMLSLRIRKQQNC